MTLSDVTTLYAQIWNFFSIEVPLLGITFGQLWLGVFVVTFSITVLKPLLGIGNKAFDDVSASASKRIEMRRNKRNKESRNKRNK